MPRFDPNLPGDADNNGMVPGEDYAPFDPSCSLISPPPSNVDERLHDYFNLAKVLTITPPPGTSNELLLQIHSFEDWVELAMDNGIPKVVLDVIRLLAVVKPTERPSALQALESREYKASRTLPPCIANRKCFPTSRHSRGRDDQGF
jgi:hypothetical protein